MTAEIITLEALRQKTYRPPPRAAEPAENAKAGTRATRGRVHDWLRLDNQRRPDRA
jgi:hypothetical protein